jgi:hypothetical protein
MTATALRQDSASAARTSVAGAIGRRQARPAVVDVVALWACRGREGRAASTQGTYWLAATKQREGSRYVRCGVVEASKRDASWACECFIAEPLLRAGQSVPWEVVRLSYCRLQESVV